MGGALWPRPLPRSCRQDPSLKISDELTSRGIDVHCFAGCDWKDIKNELRRQGLLDGALFGPTSVPAAG